MPSIFDKLDAVITRYNEIEEAMGRPEVATDFEQVQTLARERASLETLVNIAHRYRKLADEQKEAFWSLCDEYQAGLRPLHERTVILIEDYAKNFYSLTDEQAESMLDEALDIDGDRVALKKAFVKNARGKLPAKTVARYIQLENKLEAVVAYEMARQIPLVR